MTLDKIIVGESCDVADIIISDMDLEIIDDD